MALKALMLRKRIDLKNREMASVRDQLDALKEREDELARAIDEVQQEEEQAAVQEAVDQLIEELKTSRIPKLHPHPHPKLPHRSRKTKGVILS